jgi:transposase
MTSETYSEHILPLIEAEIVIARRDGQEEPILMQDNAPAHSARATILELTERHIQYMKWPPRPPDLNPIENVWAYMKTLIDQERVERGGHITAGG